MGKIWGSLGVVVTIVLATSPLSWAGPVPSSDLEAAPASKLSSTEALIVAHLDHLEGAVRDRALSERDRAGQAFGKPALADQIERFARRLEALEEEILRLDPERAEMLYRRARSVGQILQRLRQATVENSVHWIPPADQALQRALKVSGPINDDCAAAVPIGEGTFSGSIEGATADGEASCRESASEVDIWYRYTSSVGGLVIADTGGTIRAAVSVHSACPGTTANELACSSNRLASAAVFDIEVGAEVLIRVAALDQSDPFTLNVGPEGVISGTVTDAVTGEPVPSVAIDLFGELGTFREVLSDDLGRYEARALSTGTYWALALPTTEYVEELYDDIHCRFGDCSVFDGSPIEVRLGVEVDGIDFALDRGATLTGTIADSVNDEPIPEARVVTRDAQEVVSGVGMTDETGLYSIDRVPRGPQTVQTVGTTSFLDELFDDIPCPFSECPRSLGTVVEAVSNVTVPSLDFDLGPAGFLSGEVRAAATGEPIPFVDLELTNGVEFSSWRRSTDLTGRFELGGQPSGSYFLRTETHLDPFVELEDELYDGIPCPERLCDFLTGTPILVTAGEETSGIDFDLEVLGSISGKITEAATGAPLAEASVDIVLASQDRVVANGLTDGEGDFLVGGLFSGAYFVVAEQPGFQSEVYDNVPCSEAGCETTLGTPVVVEAAATTADIDFALERLGSFSGTVTNAATGEPIPDAFIFRILNGRIFGAVTNTAGIYRVDNIDPGIHSAYATVSGFVDEVYEEIPCLGFFCTQSEGTPIEVRSGETTTGIDFTLEPSVPVGCQPNSTTLCLNEDRFRVQVSWTDFVGQSGSGQGIELTDDTGTFWFFSPDNVELVIKVLDGCFDPFNTFWVFAGGLTDVGVEISVTDTLTNEIRTYSNALGSAFVPIQDLDAFATCDAPGATGGSDAMTLAASEMDRLLVELDRNGQADVFSSGLEPSGLPPVAKESPVGCVSDDDTLCVAGGRFEIEMIWNTGEQTGNGRVIQLTNDTGAFWFFSPANVEAVVKVLDACDLDPFNNFWVFAAGLTDVEVTLRVTDTQTGETQQWLNPLGTPFQPIRETGAFMTCP